MGSYTVSDRVLNRIGFGACSTVVLCEYKDTCTSVAIKVLHRSEDLNPDVHHEARMYRKVLAGCDRRSA